MHSTRIDLAAKTRTKMITLLNARLADAIDLHMLISAFCFFRVSNRYTFGTIFKRDLSETLLYARHKSMITDAVLGYLRADNP